MSSSYVPTWSQWASSVAPNQGDSFWSWLRRPVPPSPLEIPLSYVDPFQRYDRNTRTIQNVSPGQAGIMDWLELLSLIPGGRVASGLAGRTFSGAAASGLPRAAARPGTSLVLRPSASSGAQVVPNAAVPGTALVPYVPPAASVVPRAGASGWTGRAGDWFNRTWNIFRRPAPAALGSGASGAATGPGTAIVPRAGTALVARTPTAASAATAATSNPRNITPLVAAALGIGILARNRDNSTTSSVINPELNVPRGPGPTQPTPTPGSVFIPPTTTGGGGGGGGGYRLTETAEERAMLERELADIRARQEAGDIALNEAWSKVQQSNEAAATKARDMAAQFGERAASLWTTAAQQAMDTAASQQAAATGFEGQQSFEALPSGAQDFVSFMQSQAPSEQIYAESKGNILASDLDWMSQMAASQGAAYRGELQREANMLSFERAREHNLRVQDRIAQERMAAMQSQSRASSSAFDEVGNYRMVLDNAVSTGNPGFLMSIYGIDEARARQLMEDRLAAERLVETNKLVASLALGND